MSAAVLGHELVGAGATRVVLTNDWLCDTSTWDGARPYLDTARFTFAFVDLRGYGRSRAIAGAFTVTEAAGDVLAVADALGWTRFAAVGHSMSALVALHLAQQRRDRVTRAVLVAPAPPHGLGAGPDGLAAIEGLARADDATRLAYFSQRPGPLLSPGWTAYKAARWRATADAEAAASYAAMFARDGLPDRTTRITVPVCALACEQDAPPFRAAAVRDALAPLCDDLELAQLAESGHYPMQEMPPRTVAVLETFLGGAR